MQKTIKSRAGREIILPTSKEDAAINAAAASKDLQDKFLAIGFAIDPGTPDALAKRNQAETVKWAKAIRDAKIEPQ
jgi:tripartite-type tricarboxylate transporter receptor subunit TctC